MYLQEAINHHKNGDINQAFKNYEEAYKAGESNPVLFQNFGALLRKKGNIQCALDVLNKGADLHPDYPAIFSNRACALWDTKPCSAVSDNLYAISIYLATNQLEEKIVVLSLIKLTVTQLLELGAVNTAYSVSLVALKLFGPINNVLTCLILTLNRLTSSTNNLLAVRAFEKCKTKLLEEIKDIDIYDRTMILFTLGSHLTKLANFHDALPFFEEGMEYALNPGTIEPEKTEAWKDIVNTNAWNFSILLLKNEELAKGWSFFDYGLVTAALGPQKWQRALVKPFTSSEIKLWKGEDLSDKHILLLEEQAVGDIMMFTTLIPQLALEAKEITMLVNCRLEVLYKRTFQHADNINIKTFIDLGKRDFVLSEYDYQSPIGTICRYRFTDLKLYASHKRLYRTDSSLKKTLKEEYLDNQDKLLVGVSWRGGGTKERLLQKSLPLNLLVRAMKGYNKIRYVSLQYGDHSNDIEYLRKNGIDIIVDSRINALVDMDKWMSQVDACDAVISIANTTIHGSGGLGIPTMCLLSIHSDWRWFNAANVDKSYWYDSVGIARQSQDMDWTNAIALVRNWIAARCPYPSGKICSE